MKAKRKLSKMLSAAEKPTKNRIIPTIEADQFLDTVGLNRVEQSFREWVTASRRADVRLARRRILLIFLLIRYTGAKLNEVSGLDPFHDIDHERQSVFFRNSDGGGQTAREVQISEALSREISSMLDEPDFAASIRDTFSIDPAFVRRKFYERTQACGLPKRLGGPEMIRKARGTELMQGNVPLPAVQKMLGHSTPNLTSSYISFSEDEIRQVTRYFMEKESSRKTSARNFFFGKIKAIKRGDIQSQVELVTVEGYQITTIITNDSMGRLGLTVGKLITAEVKAPWVSLQKGDTEPESSADNRFKGIIEQISSGAVNTEYVVRISDRIELCSVVSTGSSQPLDLRKGDTIWVLFNCYSVVLHID
ncbi:MAG: TOBE domain-containing protein [Dissulfurispiraceae bacterium]